MSSHPQRSGDPNQPNTAQPAAARCAKILTRAIEQPKCELLVNAAKSIGLTFPESFLQRADEVIE